MKGVGTNLIQSRKKHHHKIGLCIPELNLHFTGLHALVNLYLTLLDDETTKLFGGGSVRIARLREKELHIR